MSWQDLLRDNDPGAEGALDTQDAQTIRQVVVAAAQERRAQQVWWSRPAVIAAMLMLIVASGSSGVRRGPQEAAVVPAADVVEVRRQLQFATPGGTRIIWTFNPDLELTEARR